MQKDTKKLIFDTFIELLSQKPFDKITVKDIVETCDINRNTFYYYYSDIYDLLEEVFTNEFDELMEAHKNGGSWLEAFIKIANTAYRHKRIVYNICSSRSYDYFENYMYKSCKHIMVDFVQYAAKGMSVPDEDIEFLASFYEYAFLGIISEWFRTGMREDPVYLASQLWLVADNIRLSLRKSERRARSKIENGNTL
ncbi:MAG: TetR-like C-terminal domain-containing protein [Oscillospiraceae bacterium]|nr:TetR-like C-terminal domain-containing protein [Clostridiaceae bacterium]MDY5949035.1 TetR-like C-terminal domain-containing protein [Oscillospiraceae bacterium]